MAIEGLSELVKRVLMRLTFDAIEEEALTRFSRGDETVSDLERILGRSELYSQTIRRFVPPGPTGPGADAAPPLSRAILLLGMNGTRTLVAAIKVLVESGQLGLIEGESLGMLKPGDFVKRAVEAQNELDGLNSMASATGYASGLIFDLLFALAERMKSDKPVDLGYIEGVWEQARKTAKVSHALARSLEGFSFQHLGYVSGLLLELGRALQMVLAAFQGKASAWPVFEDQWSKRPSATDSARKIAEQTAFGVSPDELASLCARSTSIFKKLAPAIRRRSEPYFLGTKDRASFQLATILSASASLARKVDLTDVQLSWLKRTGIKEKTLTAASV